MQVIHHTPFCRKCRLQILSIALAFQLSEALPNILLCAKSWKVWPICEIYLFNNTIHSGYTENNSEKDCWYHSPFAYKIVDDIGGFPSKSAFFSNSKQYIYPGAESSTKNGRQRQLIVSSYHHTNLMTTYHSMYCRIPSTKRNRSSSFTIQPTTVSLPFKCVWFLLLYVLFLLCVVHTMLRDISLMIKRQGEFNIQCDPKTV